MTDADDYVSWYESALRSSELAAHQIARFKNPWWNPTWQDLIPDAPLSPTVCWGLRRKRSQHAERIRSAKSRDASAVAACSPATPLDFGSAHGSGSGSGASTSGGDEGSSSPSKRRRVGDGADISDAGGGGCKTTAVGSGRTPLVWEGAAARDIRRPGKKKTLCELQEEEKLLWKEKNMLQKEVEVERKACEALKVENLRLKSQKLHQHSEKAPVKDIIIDADISSKSHFLLPDLNEPLSENLN